MANINLDKLTQLTADAGHIFLKSEGEEVLIQLLEIQKQVEDAITEAKNILEKTALSVDPNFSSIQGNKVKVYYRAYGTRYYLDEAQANMAPKELYTVETKVVTKVDAKAVEKWVKEKGGMPVGIKEAERNKSLTFSLKTNAKEEE